MAYTYTVDTLVYKDTEIEQHDIQVWFTVTMEWAEKWCKENGYDNLEEFDYTYTWDDAYEMYKSALNEKVVISEKGYDITHGNFLDIFGKTVNGIEVAL